MLNPPPPLPEVGPGGENVNEEPEFDMAVLGNEDWVEDDDEYVYEV
jgi:hypothetical protein